MNAAFKLFPLMPAEVFNTWLQPIIEQHGWPFLSAADVFPSTLWKDFFLGVPFTTWAGLTWRREELWLASVRLHPETAQLALAVASHYLGKPGMNFVVGRIRQSKERVRSAATYIRQHRQLPGVLIGLHTIHGLHLADGIHRMAAAYTLPRNDTFVFSCWTAHTQPELA